MPSLPLAELLRFVSPALVIGLYTFLFYPDKLEKYRENPAIIAMALVVVGPLVYLLYRCVFFELIVDRWIKDTFTRQRSLVTRIQSKYNLLHRKDALSLYTVIRDVHWGAKHVGRYSQASLIHLGYTTAFIAIPFLLVGTVQRHWGVAFCCLLLFLVFVVVTTASDFQFEHTEWAHMHTVPESEIQKMIERLRMARSTTSDL